MADNEGYLEDCNALDVDKKVDRLSSNRVREQRMTKTKDKFDETSLPTPPPDPWTSPGCLRGVQGRNELKRPRSLEEEEDIIAYLTDLGTPPFESQTSECPSRNSATSTMAVPSFCSEEAFEHLDRLYALTKQILELRNRNSRFFKRVRDLERLKALRNADRMLETAFANDKDLIADFPEEDAGFAESLLDAMLSNCRDPQMQRRNIRSPSSRRRSRSLGLSEQSLPRLSSPGGRFDFEKQISRNENTSGVPKVSKWTRVKAAFRWERACTNDIVESMDSVTTPSTPTTKYLRIPEVGGGNWSGSTLSPCTSEISGPSTPLGRISSASSSNEGSYDGPRKNASSQFDKQLLKTKEDKKKECKNRRSRSLDGDVIMGNVIDDTECTNEINHGKPLIRITSDSNPTVHPPSMERKGADTISKRQTPMLTITIPSNEEEIRSISSPESVSPLLSSAHNSGGNSPQHGKSRRETSATREFKRQRSTMEEPVTPAPKMQRQDSKWNKVRRAFLTNTAFSVPPSPVRVVSGQSFLQDGPGTPKAHSCSGSVEDLEKSSSASNAQAETRRDYQALRDKLGAEFHQKLVEWERLKNSSTRNTRENVSARNVPSSREGLLLPEERLAPEFKKKLQDWKRAKKGRRGSATIEQQRVSRRRLTDWQLWRSPSKPETRYQDVIGSRGSCGSAGSAGSTVSDGRSNLCEDFVRRMEAWRRMNDSNCREAPRRTSNRFDGTTSIDESEFLALERVLPIFADKVGRERRESDARQLDECFDGDTRFVDGTQTANCGNEVLIRTSVGSYRFEGISREFTRKLYDWEKYRGISPRSSTFRLLGPGYAPRTGETDVEPTTPTASDTKVADDAKGFLGILKRSKSVGSGIEGNIREETFIRRSTSLQSLNHIANRLGDADRTDTSPAPINNRRTEDASEDAVMDDSEPEAMIVDIEDVIEETASPLKRVQPHQTPVYSVAASETTSIAVPLGTVTSSHEPSPVFLVEVEESSSRKHWECRAWNQRKNFSSDDSPSPEHFEMAQVWNNRTESVGTDDLDSERWTLAESWNQEECSLKGSFEQYELRAWNQPTTCSNRDGDSVKSDRSICSTDWHPKSDLNETEHRIHVDFEREEIPAVSSDGESVSEETTRKREPAEKEESEVVEMIRDLGNLSALSKDTRESMDLPSENKQEREFVYEDQEEEEDGSSDDEKETVDGEMENDDVLRQIIPATAISYSSALMDPQPMADYGDTTKNSLRSPMNFESDVRTRMFDNFRARREDEVTDKHHENYGIIRHELQACRHRELFKAKPDLCAYERESHLDETSNRSSEACANSTSNYEEHETCVRGSLVLPRTTERLERDTHRQYHNFESISTSFVHPTSTSANFEFHREPTIQTTPLTVSSFREERCFERIIINEKTLNKVVVPTASTGDGTKNAARPNESSAANDISEEQDRQFDSNLGVSTTNRETSPKKNDSSARNVFVKTKRMIFSPFRRTDDRSTCRKENEATNDERTLRPKSKSKSRSVSPKISRQDALLRMPLSLPWPLRPSSRDREVKVEARIDELLESKHEDSDEVTIQKRDFKRSVTLEERKRRFTSEKMFTNTEVKGIQTKCRIQNANEEKTVRVTGENGRFKSSLSGKNHQVDMSVQVTPDDNQNRTPVTFNTTPAKRNETENSLRSDPLSSDLIHKLKILSTVAARRDGRTNTIAVDSPLESHSSRIRRAKESFLSRRGGPLCHSVIETQTSESSSHDFPSNATEHYEEIVESKERTTGDPRDTRKEDTIEKGLTYEEIGATSERREEESSMSEINDARSEASSTSRPDLIKSASAGMINVDPDTFGRLAEPNRGCESLPRTISKRRESSGPLARIVNKFKFSRLIRGKENEEGNMSTISRLCRQSLLIDVQSEFEEHQEGEDQDPPEEVPKDNNDEKKIRDPKK